MKLMAKGILATTAPVITMLYMSLACPSVFKEFQRFNPRIAGNFDVLFKTTSGRKKLFHVPTNEIKNTVDIAGVNKRLATLQNTFHSEAPSMRAASSTASGTP